MNSYLKYTLSYFLTLLLLVGCNDSLPVVTDDPTAGEKAKRTVLVYMVAENSLSNSTDGDVQELAYAANRGDIADGYNILVYKDNATMPSITLYNKLGTTTWKTWSKERDSADSTVMLSTLQYMMENYPSEHYALVLWSHGSGWGPRKATIDEETERRTSSARSQARAFGVDNGKNSMTVNGDYGMNVSSVKWVLEQLGTHMDYIMWDACLMQGVETAYELRKHTDWIIGSPTETPGLGAPYHTIAKALCEADMPAILDAYSQYYDNSTVYQRMFPLSIIKTSELEALARATAPHVKNHFADSENMPAITGTAQVYSPRRFVYVSSNYSTAEVGSPIAYDMGSIMAGILTEEEYTAWRAVLDKAVPYKTMPTESWLTSFAPGIYGTEHCTMTDATHYSGISMNVPQDNYDIYPVDSEHIILLWWNVYFRTFDWWKAAGWNETYWANDPEYVI